MYAQLGDIVFEGLNGFQSLQRDRAARLAEHQLIDGKSRLQKTGDDLIGLSFEIQFHAEFCQPATEVKKLTDAMEGGIVCPLVDGQGLFWGNFVIASVSETFNFLSNQGGIISLSVSVTVKEWIDPDPVSTKLRAGQKTAIALADNGVVPVRPSAGTPSPIGFVTAKVTSARSSSLAAVANVNDAVETPSQSETLLARAAKKVEQASEAASDAVAKLQEANSLAQKAPDLLDALDTVIANANAMKGYCENGDLNNALTQSQSLTDATGAMDVAVRPLNIDQILRKP